MQNLEIHPEFFQCGLKFYNSRYLKKEDNLIDIELLQAIVEWNNKYLNYVRLSEKLKKLFGSDIYELDRDGYNFKVEIEKKYDYKVYYFSERFLKYLAEPPDAKEYFISHGIIDKFLLKFIKPFIASSYGRFEL